MVSFTLVSHALLLTAALVPCRSAAQPDSLSITNARMVWPDSIVPIEHSEALLLGHPGVLRADLAFTGHEKHPKTDEYVAPHLDALWSITDAAGEHMGPRLWNGGEGVIGPIPLLEWDPLTGEGIAEISIPIGGELGLEQFPYLPSGHCELRILLGQLGQIGLDAAGNPTGAEWEGALGFPTDLPHRLALLEEKDIRHGESCVFLLTFNPPLQADETFTLETIGPATLVPAGMEPGGPWTFDVPAGSRGLAITFWAHAAGAFKVRATGEDGSSVDSQIIEILDDYPIFADYVAEADSSVQVGGGAGQDPYAMAIDGYFCKVGRGADPDGDKLINCTRPFVELIEEPLNPNCGSKYKSYYYPTRCFPGEPNDHCQFEGEEEIEVPQYEFVETVDRNVGEVEVEAGVSVSGEMNFWLVGSAQAGAHVSGSVMSKVTRRCCLYRYSGREHTIRVPGCKEF